MERGERVFPVSDHSSDIVNALVQKAKDSGCRFLHNCRIKELLLEQTDDGQTVRGALTESGEKILADAVIVATGGKSYPATGSTGDGYQLARQAGHRVTPLRPSLIPLVCKEKYCRDMMGLSLKKCHPARGGHPERQGGLFRAWRDAVHPLRAFPGRWC